MEEKLFHQYHITYSIPKSLNKEVYSSGELLKKIENINKVNLFVGANNSGKSKLIREVLKENLLVSLDKKTINEINKMLAGAIDDLEKYFLSLGYESSDVTIRNFSDSSDTFSLKDFTGKLSKFDFNYLDATRANQFVFPTIKEPKKNTQYRTSFNGRTSSLDTGTMHEIFITVNEIVNKLKNSIDIYRSPKWDVKKIYIPSVRTLREFASRNRLSTDTAKEYDIKLTNVNELEINIENGEDFYGFILSNKNAKTENRRRVERFEKFLSDNFFSQERVEITSFLGESKVIHIKIGNEKEQPIYNLGDGLQMIIILTFPFFMFDSGIVAIEEPELFIHPGLQKKFLDFLVNHPVTKNFQVFIATHSNHFIDAVNESDLISIFTVSKKFKKGDTSEERLPDFHIENVAFGHENCLSLLGVNNSSVYLANSTIWIEGVTDKLYLSKYISEYLKNPKLKDEFKQFKSYQEGVHYSFVYSAGDNIIHWDFDENSEYKDISKNIIAKKLCGKAMVIVDNDYGKNKNRKKALSELLQERLVELDVPEVENLLSEVVIKKTLLDYPTINALGEQALKKPSKQQLINMKVGSLIDEVILEGSTKGKRFASSDSSNEKGKTIKSSDKLDFCKKAIAHIAFDNMTDKSRQLVEQILKFVIEQNSKFI